MADRSKLECCTGAIFLAVQAKVNIFYEWSGADSSQSLELLKNSLIRIAGSHLKDEATGESNLPAVRKQFPKGSVAVISYAIWEEGIVVARGNAKNIKDITDLARKDVSIINREAGAGSRNLLDSHLQKFGIFPRNVRGIRTRPPSTCLPHGR